MVPDPLSPIAPARVRALLLPIGRIKRSRFLDFVERLKPENIVRLGDVSPDGRPNRSTCAGFLCQWEKILTDETSHSDVLAASLPHGQDHLRLIALAPTSVTASFITFRAI
jgi:hypothetical protein